MPAIRSLTPFLHVADVERSIAFYRRLGFGIQNTHTMQGASAPTWAYLESDRAHLMVARADGPVDPEQQAVLFWLYADDVAGMHAKLREAGIDVGPIQTPFWSPRGEFRVTDPDGYGLMIAHV